MRGVWWMSEGYVVGATYHIADIVQPNADYTLVNEVDGDALFVFELDTPLV